jgi:hypothetical protein
METDDDEDVEKSLRIKKKDREELVEFNNEVKEGYPTDQTSSNFVLSVAGIAD